MRDKNLVEKAVKRTAQLLLETLREATKRIQPALGVFPDKLAIFDLILAALYLVWDGLLPDQGFRKHGTRFACSALARLQDKPKSTYTFDLDLGDRVTSRTLDIPDKVDPFEYYLGTQVWIDHPKSSVPIKAFRKLEPGEAVRKVKPFSEQEQWIVDQCNRSGIAQGLLTMTRIITSYHMSPPRSIESFCISMLRKAVPYEPLSNRKRDVLRQMVRGDESIEVLRFGSIVPVLIKGRVHCFLPISVVENTTSEWTRYAVMLTPNDSTPTLKAMREKLAESDEEKQRRRQAEHPSSL